MQTLKTLLRYILLSLTAVSTVCVAQQHHSCYFTHTNVSTSYFENTAKVECFEDDQKIGYLYYTKIPFLSSYVIYDFYIYVSFRKKGYGSCLLKYVCHYLAKQRGSKVYLQAGPFELYTKDDKNTNLYASKLDQLIKFYQHNQFVIVNRLLQYLAYLFYICLGICQDSRYLMVRALNYI